jgi:hypothetical protein
MSDERRYDVLAPQVIQLQRFTARQVKVSNMLPRWLYLRTGGTDIPTAGNCDIAVPPMTEMTEPISPTSMVSVGLGVVIVTLGQQVESNKAILTFYDSAQPGAVGSIDLNPSRMGNMAQQKFVAPGSYTMAFPVTMVHVSNYSPAWVYVKFGSLVVPTAATADVTLPPMSEKSLACLPATQFAFGLSANLVTTGQQVPAGVNIIATFYEYPTPVTIGTADLNPSKMGQMAQQKFTVSSSYTIGFRVTTVHVANYSKAWVYVKFNSLVIPTATTADVALPPMSEKSLTCLPYTDFAFGLSADLVTTGQQIPAGVQIIATFFEYPTPISVGTADLNPSKLGQSVSFRFTANSVIDPAFPVSQVNISNYLRNWIYATYRQTNRLRNPDFEDWPGLYPTDWSVLLTGLGTVTKVAGYRGSNAARCTQGVWPMGDHRQEVYQDNVCVPGEALTLSFWHKNDGVTTPYYYVYDITGGAMIVPQTSIASQTNWDFYTISFVIPAGCVSFRVAVGVTEPVQFRYADIDTLSVQATTTAANAQIAVPPMSEKSITLPPSDHIDVVVGTQTVMIATGIPVTSAIFTCYEYAVPTNLGVAPLSPGGFRYHELLHNVVAIPSGTLLERDLSNFAMARYTLKSNEIAATTKILYLAIWDYSDGVMNTVCATIPLFRERWASVTFHAGKKILIEYEESGLGTFALSDTLEAW